jgi:hypothetical protein
MLNFLSLKVWGLKKVDCGGVVDTQQLPKTL